MSDHEILIGPTIWEPGEPRELLDGRDYPRDPNLYRIFIFRLVLLDPQKKLPEERHRMEYLQKDGTWVEEKHDYYASPAEAEEYLRKAA